MKIRTDFVSNSSSSSFIIGHNEFFDHFNVTKDDIVNVLIEIYGKNNYDNYIADVMKRKEENPDWYNNDDCLAPFEVFDMTIEDDRKKAIEKYEYMLSDWIANRCALDYQTGDITWPDYVSLFKNICNYLERIYNTYGLDHRNWKDCTIFERTKEKQPDGCYGIHKPLPDYLKKTIKDLRKRCGIMTNADVLKHELSRFFIHYADNEIWSYEHQCYGKSNKKIEIYDENDDALIACYGGKDKLLEQIEYAKKRNAEIDSSKYESDYMTAERVFEVLFNKLVEYKKINLDDKFLSEYFELKDNSWRKKDGAIYDTNNGKTYTWHDFYNNCLTINVHEG